MLILILSSVIAVHGYLENAEETWRHPQTGIEWLRDLLPRTLPQARITLYSYEVSVSEKSSDAPAWITSRAESLLGELAGERELAGAVQRPIIFVCHDFGGILIKRALALARQSSSRKLSHRHAVYLSTYAIIFLGTPHKGYASGAEDQLRSQRKLLDPTHLAQELESVDSDFTNFVQRFRIFCFWEEQRTQKRFKDFYVVDRESAVPDWPEIEKSGIAADHSHMCKFSTLSDGGFGLIAGACKRYTSQAAAVIAERHKQDLETSRKAFEAQVAEDRDLFPVTLDENDSKGSVQTFVNQHFFAPRMASTIFTGRRTLTLKVQQALLLKTLAEKGQHKIFVLYGLGGSGKTQFCLKFAQDYKDRYACQRPNFCEMFATCAISYAHIFCLQILGSVLG